VTDEELLSAIELLAATEGIFTEPAGGTTLAVTKKLIEQGRIPRDESIVVCITGNGYKTSEIFTERLQPAAHLGRSLKDFDAFIAARKEDGADATARAAVKAANGVRG
jgi:threonine synthase